MYTKARPKPKLSGQRVLDPDLQRIVTFVVAKTPDAGKTTFAHWIAAELGTTVGTTSEAAATSYERRHGLALGTVRAARLADRNAFRSELGEEGRLMHAAGAPPAVVCLRDGHRVIEGVRLVDELDAARIEAQSFGLVSFVVCLSRPGREATDNTESVLLAAKADLEIDNRYDLAWLRHHVGVVLVRARAYAHTNGKEVSKAWQTSRGKGTSTSRRSDPV